MEKRAVINFTSIRRLSETTAAEIDGYRLPFATRSMGSTFPRRFIPRLSAANNLPRSLLVPFAATARAISHRSASISRARSIRQAREHVRRPSSPRFLESISLTCWHTRASERSRRPCAVPLPDFRVRAGARARHAEDVN